MDLSFVEPQILGFDSEKLKELDGIIQRGLEDRLYTGAVYLIGGKAGMLEPGCLGRLSWDCGKQVRPDTVFDLASLTKPIATAASILILMEQGRINLEQPLADFFPDSSHKHLHGVNVFQLLTHTSGLPAWKDFYTNSKSPDDVVAGILRTPLDNPPGEIYTYSCLGYILLGEIVRITSGMKIDQFAAKYIFTPLEMKDTMFNPSGEILGRTAVTANSPSRKHSTLLGQAHDGNAWAMGGVSGNAGLFSTALDLAKFGVMLLSEGGGVLLRESVELMFKNLLDPATGGHTAGWFTYPNELLPGKNLQLPGIISHTGFTGTSIVIDGCCDIFVTLLTNRVCKADVGTEFRKTRRLFHDAAMQAMLR